MMCLREGRDTLMSVLPAISCCPCCDTPSLSSLRVILGTGAYYHFSSQRFPLKRLFLRVVKTNAVFKFFFCNQLLANDLSCLFFSGKALCPPSALRRLCSTWPSCIPHPLCAGVQLGVGCLEPLTL